MVKQGTNEFAPLESVLLEVSRRIGLEVGERIYEDEAIQASEIDDAVYPMKIEDLRKIARKYAEEIEEETDRVHKLMLEFRRDSELDVFIDAGVASKHQVDVVLYGERKLFSFKREIAHSRKLAKQPCYYMDHHDSSIVCSEENVSDLIDSRDYDETIDIPEEDCAWSISRSSDDLISVAGPLLSIKTRDFQPILGFNGQRFSSVREMLTEALFYAIPKYLPHLLD